MNSNSSPLMQFNRNCNQVIEESVNRLARSGFTVVESFDLQVARANHSDCTCPQHGTDQCACQLAILLVYEKDALPISLMVHGNQEWTEISIVETPDQKIKPALRAKITAALQPEYFFHSGHESVTSVS